MKKRMQVLLGLLLCLVLVAVALQPVRVEATAATVYLDPQGGDDTADGLTEATAVKSFDTAYGKIKTAGGGTIVFTSTLTLTTETRLPNAASSVPVALTSKTGAEGITSSDNIRFMCDTTLENITLTMSSTNNNRAICGEGKKLVIGANVNSVPMNGVYFNIHGGARWAKCASTDVTVTSGTWRNIYVGAYGYSSGKAGVTGNAKLTMTGGTVTGYIAPSYQYDATIGSMDITISNATVATIYCAAVSNGTISGDVNLTLGEGAVVTGSVYAGGNGSGSVNGNVNITLDGADTTGYTRISGSGASAFTGTVGAAKLLLKSGKLAVTPTNMTSANIAVESGKTLTLANSTVNADILSCAGTLAFAGTAQVNATTVVGSVNCTVTDDVIGLHNYVTAPAGSAITFAQSSVTEENGVWSSKNMDDFKGLVLTAADDVKIRFYKGFSSESANLLQPVYSEGNTHYYSVQAGNKYRYSAQGTTSGKYYTYVQNVYITEEEAQVKTVIDVTPDLRPQSAWNPPKVQRFTDEAMANFPSSKDLWPAYQDVFTTPAFQEGKAANEITTQPELEAFIDKLDDENDNMYVFIAGQSAGTPTFDIPLVIFTKVDISGCKTIAEAAELIRADGKLIVHEQAHMHGTEPASGEGALAVMQRLDGAYGDDLLDSMHIYMFPRLNPYGAYHNQRESYNPGDLDLNGDFMKQTMPEIIIRTDVSNLFEPDIVLDNHEYTINYENASAAHKDVMICAHTQTEYSQEYTAISQAIAKAAMNRLTENGLTYGWYTDVVWGRGSRTGSGYSSNRGSIHILMESHGGAQGTMNYERRTMGHVSSLTGIFDYLKENHETVKKVVRDQKAQIIELGKTFSEDDRIIVEATTTQNPDLEIPGNRVNLATGALIPTTFAAKTTETIVRTRAQATAYVLPASLANMNDILALMDRHLITYAFVPENSVISLRGYVGSATLAELTQEQNIRFSEGAYVFCMNQQSARILAYFMEPDLSFASKTTLVNLGYISATDEVFPIYRYEHDLNSAGFIDYTVTEVPEAPEGLTADVAAGEILGLQADKKYEYRAADDADYTPVAAGATKITGLSKDVYYVRYQATGDIVASEDAKLILFDEAIVYMHKAAGSDTNDGYTEAKPVSTFAQAVAQLKLRLNYLPEGAKATVILLADYEITGKIVNLTSHDFPITITSKDGTVGIKRTATAQYNRLSLGGDVTFENMTFAVEAPDYFNYLLANGHKLIIGKNVTCKGSYNFNLVGGQFNTATGSTYLEVHSGTWQNIYYGGYNGQVDGDVTFIMTGGSVKASVMTSYDKKVTGNVTVSISNANITKLLYLGVSGVATIGGDLNVTLGEGLVVPEIYVGGNKGSVAGTATVTVDGADLTDSILKGRPKTSGTVNKSILVYKSGKLGTYSDFDEFKDMSVTEPEVVKGDLNGDGNVSDADAMYLLRYTLFGDSRYPLNQGGDVNGDGNISDADAMYLLRYTLFGDTRYPLH